jgi:hypothetical protein
MELSTKAQENGDGYALLTTENASAATSSQHGRGYTSSRTTRAACQPQRRRGSFCTQLP